MKNDTHADHTTRESILMLLSDDEVASVSAVEATARLLDGEEYLDLENLDQGVQNALVTATAPMGHVLPRRSVREKTWGDILERLATLHTEKAPPRV
jgi:hypothetical protein